MIIPQTTRLIKAAAKLTGFTQKAIFLRTRDRQVNAVRSAIWTILLELGHNRQRISEAFGCDYKTVQWALDHPTAESNTLAHKLRSASPEYQNCGSGIDYGVCSKCGKGHGWTVFSRELLPSAAAHPKPTAPNIGLRYSR